MTFPTYVPLKKKKKKKLKFPDFRHVLLCRGLDYQQGSAKILIISDSDALKQK